MLDSASSSISLSSLSWLSGKSPDQSSPIFVFTAIHCMDLDRLGHGPSRRRPVTSYPDTRYSDMIDPSTERRQQPHSNPLPQTEWANVSLTDRQQQQRPATGRGQRSGARRAASARSVYTAWNPADTQSMRSPTNSRKQSRRHRFRKLLLGEDDDTEDESLAAYSSSRHPGRSARRDRLSTHSAPFDLEYGEARSAAQSSGTGYMFPSTPDYPSPTGLPRSPTYPPTVRHRVQNSLALDDAALADAEEFHLFVQATTGLELEDTYAFNRQGLSSSPSPLQQRQRIPPQLTIPHTTSTESVSPIEESSMTMDAMRHLAQMPEGSESYLSNLGLQSQPFQTRNNVTRMSPVDGFDDLEDELPDYEESQAQAHAHQRTEAARRAQELHRRWRLTGARRGIPYQLN